MAYEQLLPFYPNDMGREKGWCLKNCRLGFHIYKPRYANAKTAMEAAKRNGTYHSGNPPENISVPVYTQSTSPNGHVIVYHKGLYYSDGKRYGSFKGILGWDEIMDGTRVVKLSSKKSFLPAKGYWTRYDVDDRVAALARFMRRTFPDYTPAKALGSTYGDNLFKSIKEFQRRTGLYPDGNTGPLTYKKLKEYGFNY